MARILVIENQVELRREFSSMFEHNQHDFYFAYRIEQGIELCTNVKPDLIVIDNSFPLVMGITFLKHLKSQDTLKEIPVLMITSSSNSIEQNLAIELGANDFIEKPFDPSIVRLRINTWVAHRALKSVVTKSFQAEDLEKLKKDIKVPVAGIVTTVQLLELELRSEEARNGLHYIKTLAFRINSILENLNEKESDSQTMQLVSTT